MLPKMEYIILSRQSKVFRFINNILSADMTITYNQTILEPKEFKADGQVRLDSANLRRTPISLKAAVQGHVQPGSTS